MPGLQYVPDTKISVPSKVQKMRNLRRTLMNLTKL